MELKGCGEPTVHGVRRGRSNFLFVAWCLFGHLTSAPALLASSTLPSVCGNRTAGQGSSMNAAGHQR